MYIEVYDFFARVFLSEVLHNYSQENENCDVMIKRKAELQLRVNHVCESMEISMARLEQSSKEIEKCDTIIIIPKVFIIVDDDFVVVGNALKEVYSWKMY